MNKIILSAHQPSKVITVQECDATGDAKSYVAGFIKKDFEIKTCDDKSDILKINFSLQIVHDTKRIT